MCMKARTWMDARGYGVAGETKSKNVHKIAGLIISQTSCPDIFQEGGLVYMVTYTNFTSQVVKLVPKLTGKCPVTDF